MFFAYDIDDYKIDFNLGRSNLILGTIWLYSNSVCRGIVTFRDDTIELPTAEVRSYGAPPAHKKGYKVHCYKHYKEMPLILDVLRNEKPVRLTFDTDRTDPKLTTQKEEVGEGE